MQYITPRKSLNRAYLKVKPLRTDIDNFKINLVALLDQINHAETEEFNKNVVADFLKSAFYQPNFFINTKGRNDLVIHNNKTANDSVGVIIEVKRSVNASEMIKSSNLNNKAMQELVLYYLRERITLKNLEIRNLIVTNVNEWFIFDANVFEKKFAQNKKLVQKFIDFEAGLLSGKTTDFFYKEIASGVIDEVKDSIEFTYFNIAEIEVALRNSDKGDDTKLIPFYKLLSPQHLLKIPFANDSNSLNKSFYTELLHIIGLEETKVAGKKIIARKSEGERYSGSLIENSIIQIESLDKLSRLNNKQSYGENKEEQLFNTAIELAITWVNRILFLKLLEAQLISYHKNDKSYSFLNIDTIKDFYELNTLFFQVLAVKTSDRNTDVKNKFSKIPYLNSSLFEPAEIEHNLLFISNLSDDKKLPIISSSVLKNTQGKKIKGELNAIEYLFSFLNSYDFTSDTKDEIQDDNKSLINASVLGLIFEKINGYKDGSFFTPGFVTMYMSRAALRQTVVDKVNKIKGLKCNNLLDIYNSNIDAAELNEIIDSIKLCDPAVGSGHFLVSALNEFIAIKAELEVLQDKDGKRLKNYTIEVANDELIVTDEDGELYEYNPSNPASQRVQETLFNEKQLIIENCLFGVDINPNSVKICRLRLWIELLKNTYYNSDGELVTLPNIDINIKCGNSLISRFGLDENLKSALLKSKLNITQYKSAVQSYRAAKSKDEKHEMEKLINDVKAGFSTEMYKGMSKVEKLEKAKIRLTFVTTQSSLFDVDKTTSKATLATKIKLEKDIAKLESDINDIKTNRIYQNAFEWRFEFPEVLDDNGKYIGFDVVIGNPPYGVAVKDATERNLLVESLGKVPDYEIYYMFINRSMQLVSVDGTSSLIIPNTFLFNVFAANYRLELLNNHNIIDILDCTSFNIFDDATVSNAILTLNKSSPTQLNYKNTSGVLSFATLVNQSTSQLDIELVKNNNINWSLLFRLDSNVTNILNKIKLNSKTLSSYFPDTSQGLIAYDKLRGQTEEFIKARALHKFDNSSGQYKNWLWGEDVTEYAVKWNSKEFLDYSDLVANPRQPKYFFGDRILVREITNPKIFAAYTNEELYFDPALIVILNADNGMSLFTLLAILNSNLATFYHFNSSPKATKGSFPKILIFDINNFPLPSVLDAKLVASIDVLVKINIANNSYANKQELNSLVYKLYNLNDVEINYIEGIELN